MGCLTFDELRQLVTDVIDGVEMDEAARRAHDEARTALAAAMAEREAAERRHAIVVCRIDEVREEQQVTDEALAVLVRHLDDSRVLVDLGVRPSTLADDEARLSATTQRAAGLQTEAAHLRDLLARLQAHCAHMQDAERVAQARLADLRAAAPPAELRAALAHGTALTLLDACRATGGDWIAWLQGRDGTIFRVETWADYTAADAATLRERRTRPTYNGLPTLGSPDGSLTLAQVRCHS